IQPKLLSMPPEVSPKMRHLESEASLYKLDALDSNWYAIVIPGNPGIVGYYEEFMHSLWTKLDGQVHVWALSHRGHGDSFNSSKKFSLAEQVEHKVKFLETALPEDAKMVLIGHSIGCQMILELLRRQARGTDRVARCLLLFPTIERMRESPQGRIVAPLLSLAPLRWLAMALVALLSLLIPLAWRRGFAARCLSAVGHSNANPGAVAATERLLLSPSVLGNVLYMAHTEMQDVRQPDLATIRQHSQRILLYYGTDDHWCPTEYFADMRRSCPEVDARLDEGDVAHAFVLEHSVEMADLCAGWVRECTTAR
ncbi:hypothetical protein BOX15_Mlig015165g4, partial [Macrostomum lignano]